MYFSVQDFLKLRCGTQLLIGRFKRSSLQTESTIIGLVKRFSWGEEFRKSQSDESGPIQIPRTGSIRRSLQCSIKKRVIVQSAVLYCNKQVLNYKSLCCLTCQALCHFSILSLFSCFVIRKKPGLCGQEKAIQYVNEWVAQNWG